MSAPNDISPSSISRRIESTLRHLKASEHEEALIHLAPAIDKTAKRRRDVGVGPRIRSFLADEERLITYLGTGIAIEGFEAGNMSLPKAIYEFLRNPIAHEGELDPRLEFVESDGFAISDDKWSLPVPFLHALCLSVILAPENSAERLSTAVPIGLFGQVVDANALWGQRELVRRRIDGLLGI